MRAAVVPTLHSDCRHPGDDWMLPSWTVALSSSNSGLSRDTVTKVEPPAPLGRAATGSAGVTHQGRFLWRSCQLPPPSPGWFSGLFTTESSCTGRWTSRAHGEGGGRDRSSPCARPSSALHTRVLCTPALLLFPLCRVGQDSHTRELWAHMCALVRFLLGELTHTCAQYTRVPCTISCCVG